MPRLELIGRQIVEGERTITVPLPVGVTTGALRFARNNWPDGSRVLQAHGHLSLDGEHWSRVLGVGFAGGDRFFQGDLIVESVGHLKVTEPENPDRQLRVRIECKVPLDLTCHLDLE